MCGIYKIENKLNHKVYIGQSKNIKRRIMEHKRRLNNNKHQNRHLQYSWNKYGEDNFDFSIIVLCDIKYLNEMESYWINYYKSLNQKYGYNINDVLKDEIPNSLKKYQGDNNPCNISVVRINDGKIYIKIKDAEKDNNTYNESIRNSCNNYYKYCGSLRNPVVFCYKEYYDNHKEECGKRLQDIYKLTNEELYKNRIIYINTMEVFDSASDFLKKYKAGKTANVYSCCNSAGAKITINGIKNQKLMYYHDYLSKYYLRTDIEKLIEQYDKSYLSPYYKHNIKIVCLNSLETFLSFKEASEKYNVTPSNIRRCCTHELAHAGKNIQYGNLTWVYYEEFIKLSKFDIKQYIHKAQNIRKGANNKHAKKVRCLNTQEIFECGVYAAEKYNLDLTSLYMCCRGVTKTCGTHPQTHERLRWEYIN